MADAGQFRKVRSIIEADPARKVIVVSAAGKRFKDDHKLTDLLYLCHAHKKYGVSCDPVFDMIADRYREICAELGLSVDIDSELSALREEIEAGISKDKLVSRGEYFSAKLMADFLGYDFLDAELWLHFSFDGTIDKERSYEELERLATGRRIVTPGFYGAMPDGSIRVLTRGGSDVTGALAAAALDADVYENWTDVSGILMADPRIVDDPDTIERITYNELRELSYMGAQVLHEGAVFPVREKNIPRAHGGHPDQHPQHERAGSPRHAYHGALCRRGDQRPLHHRHSRAQKFLHHHRFQGRDELADGLAAADARGF